jgi:LPXTG-motif cell wall-anchored protein
MAAEGAVSDPRELGTKLDLKAVTHADDGSSIVYGAETFAGFTDQSAAFQWGIDRDGDEDFDLIVFTEWRGGRLAGGVKDATGREIAVAAVSRPGPNAIRVSFPVAVIDGAAVYRYAVHAGDEGSQRDLAPNAGLTQHRLGSIDAPPAAPARSARSVAPTPPSAPSAAPAPAAPVPAPQANLPKTGPDDGRSLLPVAGGAFLLGGALIAAAPRRRVRRS